MQDSGVREVHPTGAVRDTAEGYCYELLGAEIGRMVDKKQCQYGDSYHKSGKVLAILYPDGVKPEQYQDMLAVVRVIDKLFRIANGNEGEEDAYRDIAGYGLLGAKGEVKHEG